MENLRVETKQTPARRTRVHRPGRTEKIDRAFEAYLDLLDTADWLRRRVRGQLAVFGVTDRGFRVLEILHRDGPQRLTQLADRCSCDRTNVDAIVRGLAKQGHVKVETAWLPAAATGASHLSKKDRAKPRRGPRVAVARLTPEGEKFFRRILPRHKQVVRAFMMGIDAREQQTLSVACRKIREGSLKFFWELLRPVEEEVNFGDLQRLLAGRFGN